MLNLIFHNMENIVESIKLFWDKPVFLLKTKKEKWGLIIFLALYIPFFLLVFQPFGVNNYDPTHKIRLEFLIAAIVFGIVNFITLFIFEFAITPYLFKGNSRLTFAIKMFTELIALSATTFLTYNLFGNFHDWSWTSFLGFIRDISLSSIIPISLIFLYYNYKKTKEEYEYLMDLPKNTSSNKELINLKSDSGKDIISISKDAILFVEAQDNYVAIQYLGGDTSKRELLRTTMKTLEEKLEPYSIVRCHRSFMVNINNINKVTGNAHKLNLYVTNSRLPVPVSRSYVSKIKLLLDIHHK